MTAAENARRRFASGVAALAAGDLAAARVALRRAIRDAPDFAAAHAQIALVHLREGHKAEAEAAFARAVALDPGNGEALSDLGNLQRERGDFAAAIASYGRALAVLPDRGEIHANLGVALQESGDLDGALAAYDRAVALAPDHAEIRRNRAMGLLAAGRFAEGWEENAWRLKTRHFANARPAPACPEWDGSDPAGRTVQVLAEQGYGDTLQFVRYVPMLAARGARVVLDGPPALAPLLRPLAELGEHPAADCHVRLLDLPRRFATTLDTVPAAVPYIAADPERARAWAAAVPDGAGPRVGVAWRGNPGFKRDRLRSPGLQPLRPLFALPGVRFVSIQRDGAAADLSRHGLDRVPELGSRFADFSDTAALLANLDAVVTSDTAVAHLAGAMAKPVFLLLGFVADWRWLTGRDDSPWYPTARLFRQPAPGDWDAAVAALVEALAAARLG